MDNHNFSWENSRHFDWAMASIAILTSPEGSFRISGVVHYEGITPGSYPISPSRLSLRRSKPIPQGADRGHWATGPLGGLRKDLPWLGMLYPLVMTNIAMENGHRNSGFSHSKQWFSRAMLNYQRVYHPENGLILGHFWDDKIRALGLHHSTVLHRNSHPAISHSIPATSCNYMYYPLVI